ncbi:MAG: amidohydrolase family protein [Gammaproteobacteria bacterium]|nr:amidohydrolase family protein [Gammaproteobacteria bacterium]
MTHDLVIRGGTIVDGTGTPPFEADVAVDGDRIAQIGDVSRAGREEISARGLVVSPGFIDLHTHLDAQIGWDPQVTSVSWHGVTTALLGNCGVTFAPCKASDREFLAGMMETVEDIPKNAILHGLPWNWESYGGYLDALEQLGPSINIAGLVGHCAVRFYVMGERAVEEPATEDEIRQIAELAGRSVAEGAVGFSTNRLPQHVLPDGRSIPGTFAHRDELRAVARAVGAHGGLMQTVSDFREFDAELDLIADEARMARGALFSSAVELGHERLNERVMQMRAEGLNVTSVTVPRSGGGVGGLSTDRFFPARVPVQSWKALRDLDPEARLAAIRNPDTRQRIVDEVKKLDDNVAEQARRWFYLGDGARPHYTRGLNESLHHLAQAAGEHPVETFLRITDETDGRALFHMRGFNVDLEALEQLIQTEWAMPGLGDAGAHVSQMIDSGWSTFILSHWHRDTGVYTLEEAVRRMTSVPAGVLGLDDRGVLAVGKRADLNVFDIDAVEERMPQIVHDFPFGAPRFIQRAAGYHATVCNGEVVLRDDELTEARAGRVLRTRGP